MRKDKGLNGDLDRLPMLTWIRFLKFLDDMERVEETNAALAVTARDWRSISVGMDRLLTDAVPGGRADSAIHSCSTLHSRRAGPPSLRASPPLRRAATR